MPTTTITFGTAETISASTMAWTDPGNALASDDSDATADLTVGAQTTEWLRVTNGNFSAIRGAATLTAFAIPVEGSYSGGGASAQLFKAQLVRSAAALGDEDTTTYALTTSDVTNTFVGLDPIWGNIRILRSALDSTFGGQVKAMWLAVTPTVALDHVYMTIAWDMRRSPRSRRHARHR